MTFYASNDRIYVTDSNNNISFDTNDSMPHILGVSTYNATVNFPNTTGGEEETGYNSCLTQALVYVCAYELQNVCGPVSVYECKYVSSYVCKLVYNFSTNSYSTQCSYETDYVCEYVTKDVCTLQNVYVCNNEWQCQAYTYYDYYYDAKEWSQTQVLGDLPSSIDCDFILIKATGVRTSIGGINYYAQDLLSTVNDSTTFSFQGSALIETSAVPDGTKFLSRIISIYPNYSTNKLMLEAKHSNKVVHPPANSDNNSRRSIASSFTFTFNVYFGKFQ